MPNKENEPEKESGGEYGDTQSTINANIELVKITEDPKPKEKPNVKWIQD